MQERRRIKSIILKVKKSIFRYANMKSNFKMVLFYTGLSKPLFEWLLKYVPNKIVWKKLKLEDHLLGHKCCTSVPGRLQLLADEQQYRSINGLKQVRRPAPLKETVQMRMVKAFWSRRRTTLDMLTARVSQWNGKVESTLRAVQLALYTVVLHTAQIGARIV